MNLIKVSCVDGFEDVNNVEVVETELSVFEYVVSELMNEGDSRESVVEMLMEKDEYGIGWDCDGEDDEWICFYDCDGSVISYEKVEG